MKKKSCRPEQRTKIDYAQLRRVLEQLDIYSTYNQNVHVEYYNFVTILKSAITLSAVKKTSNKYNVPVCPWMTSQILGVLKEKDKWYHKWTKHKNNNYYLSQFKHFRNRSVIMLRKRKKEYYSTKIRQADGNTKMIWEIVNDAIGRRANKQVLPDLIEQNTADTFNDYFTNIGPLLAAQLPYVPDSQQSLSPITNSFVMREIEINEIISGVENLRIGKAAGLDTIPIKLLKDNIDILCIHLLHLFNHTLESGIYPNELKIAKVVPIFKDGDSSAPSSYRPISVLSVINTVFEKILCKRIKDFITKYSIFCHNQHGFRPNRSTSSAVLVLTQHLYRALHESKIAVVVYLDIKKAFDTVNHSILLYKLHQYGFRGKMSELFNSYLSNRKQCVVINDFVSTPRTVLTGVPQGSVLGPILFSLYVNDFPSILKYSEALMYADDTALIFVGDTIGELQDKINEELTRVLTWFTSNQLTINLMKSKYTVFHSKKKAINYEEIVIQLDNTELQHVACYKYLGVLFDSDMHWKSQIKHICSKIAYGCYTLLKARECFDLFILRILYFAFVHSQLVYCIESWGNTYVTYLDPVIRLQKRAIRFITFSKTTDHSRPLFQSLNVLPYSCIYKLKIAQTVRKIIESNEPLSLNLFRSPRRQTRAAANYMFNLPPCHNAYGQRLIEFNGALVWNEIPINIKLENNFMPSLMRFFREYEM